MIDEHELVIIIGLKVNQFFCDLEKVQIGHSDAQLIKYVYSVCQSACDLTVIMFPHRVRRKE